MNADTAPLELLLHKVECFKCILPVSRGDYSDALYLFTVERKQTVYVCFERYRALSDDLVRFVNLGHESIVFDLLVLFTEDLFLEI